MFLKFAITNWGKWVYCECVRRTFRSFQGKKQTEIEQFYCFWKELRKIAIKFIARFAVSISGKRQKERKKRTNGFSRFNVVFVLLGWRFSTTATNYNAMNLNEIKQELMLCLRTLAEKTSHKCVMETYKRFFNNI